jgi:D-galactarolactone cycloisomerase
MTRIREIRLTPLRHALAEPYGMARGLAAARQCTLVELETDDGITGIGEAWGPPAAVRGYFEAVKDAWIGRDLFAHAQALPALLGRNYHFGIENQMLALASGIDIAAHDAIGKRLGLPVHALIGGKATDRVAVYASGGYMTADPRASLDAMLERFLGRGFLAAKMKIGHSVGEDVARVARARDMLGEAMLLMVDINGNCTADQALASIRAIERFGIHWVEEPLAPLDWAGYRWLRDRSPVPIATGEALYTAHQFNRLGVEGCADIWQPDLTLCGGLSQGRLIAGLAHLHHKRLSPHVWGSGIGLAAAVHLVAAHAAYPATAHPPDPTFVEYDVGENPLRDELLANPLVPIDGFIAVPDGPGLGIALDPDAVRRLSAEA